MKFFYYSVLGFITICFGYFLHSLYLTNFLHYVYPLDDAYIHLAIAKNFALNNSWSINSHGFDSTSSSILYTLLLAFFIKIFDNCTCYPLIINLFFGICSIYIFVKYFLNFYSEKELKLALLLLLPVSLLYSMTLIGMEHNMQIFFTLCVLFYLRKHQEKQLKIDFIFLIICLILLVLTRYETLFLGCAIFLYFLWKKRYFEGLIVALSCIIPITIFGLISIKNGGFFFPNSVLLKGNIPTNGDIITQFFNFIKKGIILNKSFYKWLFFPIILIILNFKKTTISKLIDTEYLSLIIIITAILHNLFAVLEFRYENYVMISLLLIITPIIIKNFENFFQNKLRRVVEYFKIMSILMIFIISGYRVIYTHQYLFYASRSVNQQQVEMSKFVKQFYENKTVALNDIGAVSYFSNANVIDLVGLGTTEVAQFLHENKNTTTSNFNQKQKDFFTKITKEKQCKIAIIYPNWFKNGLPENWIPVASWTREKGKGTAQETVVFYAFNENEAEILKNNLLKFKLNKLVVQDLFSK